MRRKRGVSVLVSCLAIILSLSLLTPAAAFKAGSGVGNLKFAKPNSAADQKYLGLEKAGEFTLKEIKAPYVILEVLRTGCPHCTEQVPAMNKLYNLVENSDLKSKLKFLGVGEGDSEAGLQKYRTARKIPFPLVADPDWDIGDAVHLTGTPTTVVLDKNGKVIWSHDGAFGNADTVFKELKGRLK